MANTGAKRPVNLQLSKSAAKLTRLHGMRERPNAYDRASYDKHRQPVWHAGSNGIQENSDITE